MRCSLKELRRGLGFECVEFRKVVGEVCIKVDSGLSGRTALDVAIFERSGGGRDVHFKHRRLQIAKPRIRQVNLEIFFKGKNLFGGIH